MLVARHPRTHPYVQHYRIRSSLGSSVKANVRVRMKSTQTRNPPVEDRSKLFPIGLPPLTAAA